MRKKYEEPIIKVVKLNPEQAVLAHCSTLGITGSDGNWAGYCSGGPTNFCKKSSSSTNVDYDAYS